MMKHWRTWSIAFFSWLIWSCSGDHAPSSANRNALHQALILADSLFEKGGTQALPNYQYLYQHLAQLSRNQQALVVSRIAECWHDGGHYNSAYALLNQTLQQETIIQDSVSLLSIRLTKARLHQDLEEVDSALVNFSKCLIISQALQLKDFEFRANFGLANAYSSHNQIGKSQQLYFKLIPEAIALKDSYNLANIYQNIAFNYQLKNKNEEVIKYYLLAKDYYKTKPSSLSYAEILNNLGTCYNSAGKLDSALNNYLASEMIFRMKNNKTGIMRSVFNQANIKQKQGKFKEAESAYWEILKNARASNIKVAEGYVLSEMAMLRFRQKKYEEAVLLIDSAFNFLVKSEIVARCHQVLKNRAEIITQAVGLNKSHPWWKQQELLQAQISSPAEDSLLLSSEKHLATNHSTNKPVVIEKKSESHYWVIGLAASLASILSIYLYSKRSNKEQKAFNSASPDQVALWAQENEERIGRLMNQAQSWKSCQFNALVMSQTLGLPLQQLELVIQHLFKQSPERFILTFRVQYASELLDDPASAWMNTEQLAASCGFNSVTDFYKGFVSITGMQPGDYQKRVK